MFERPTPTRMTVTEIAERPELGDFCAWLSVFVESGDSADELTVATAAVVRLARELRVDAVSVVGAVEYIGCPPLLSQQGNGKRRGDRYTDAMAWLVRGLFGG